jgi:hypothetical protein
MLSLKQAIDAIAQEQARGIGPADRRDFDRALAKAIKRPKSEVEHRILHLAMIRARAGVEFIGSAWGAGNAWRPPARGAVDWALCDRFLGHPTK